ncbi:MAG: peptide chain release factor N(5)-glutamine methyltransferase [Nitrospirota bacterium]
MNSLDKIRETTEFLKRFNIDDACREAELIMSHCLGIDRATLYRDNPRIQGGELAEIDGFVKRRSKREPLQYILGYTEFYGLKIKVGPGVLIPRPETELLVEEAIKIVSSQRSAISPPTHPSPSLNILDLCTGSGCLALALAKEFPDAQVYGTDISKVAIGFAKKNARINGINNVTFLIGNLFAPIKKNLKSRPETSSGSNLKFDLIVSNPPYIKKNDIKSLQPEIKDWEPVEALNGGEDGLDYYRVIIPGAKSYLKGRGYLILELGAGHADAVRKIAEDVGFLDISIKRDYAGIERILIAKN